MSDVFVSYSRRDSAFVTRLAEVLEARGKDVWLDIEGIRAGEVFPEVLRSAIEAADTVVFIITPDSAASTFCRDELDHATALSKRILPVLARPLPDADVPATVRELNWIHATDPAAFDAALDQLVEALDTDVEHVRAHTRWLLKASEWEAGGHDRSLLLRGSELTGAEAWMGAAAGREPAPTDLQREHLVASRRASSRRLRVVAGASMAVGAISVALLIVALVARHTAQRTATVAQSQALGSQALTDDNLDRSMLLARQGVSIENSLNSRSYLLSSLLRDPAAIGVIQSRFNGHASLTLSYDGSKLADVATTALTIFDVTTRRPVAPPLQVPGQQLTTAVFTPDDKLIALGGDRGYLKLLDARTGKVVRTLTGMPHPIHGLAFSPDGKLLVAVCGCEDAARTGVWRVADGKLLAYRQIRDEGSGVDFVSPSRVFVAHTHRASELIDARTLRTVRTYPGASAGAALSPDHHTVAIGGGDGTVRFLDLRTGERRLAVGRHRQAVFGISFSGDGRKLVTTSADDTAIEWDVASGHQDQILSGYAGCNCSAAVSPDARTLYTNGRDGALVIWDLAGSRRLVRPLPAGRTPSYTTSFAALSPDGRTLARPVRGGAELVATDGRSAPVALDGPAGEEATAFAFSADGHSLVVAWTNKLVELRSLPDGHVLAHQRAGDLLSDLAMRGNDEILGMTLNGAFVRSVGGAPAQSVTDFTGGVAIAVDPRADRVAVAEGGGQVEIADAKTGFTQRLIKADPVGVQGVAYSADGKWLATAGIDGARVWDARTGRPVTGVLQQGTDPVERVAFSPDGRTLAAASGPTHLYDIATGHPIGPPIGASRGLTNVWFTDRGRTLVTASHDGTALTMPTGLSAWESAACRIASRRLTRAEWRAYVPSRPYAPACR